MTKDEYKRLLALQTKDINQLWKILDTKPIDFELLAIIDARTERRFRKIRKFEVSLDRQTLNEYIEHAKGA